MEEENRRMAEEAEAEEQLLAQQAYTMAVESVCYQTVDEVFPGDLQPQPLQTSQPNNPLRRKKLTPKKKKIPPAQSTQQQPRQPTQPKEQTRLKPKEWRVPRSIAVKFSFDVGKKTAAGSEDGDYEASDVEADSDMELDSEDEYIVKKMMFFLDVFRDYCIQEGFSVSVDHVDSKRYIARCLMRDCTWMIHASVLRDKVNWAIKKLEGEHATCGRLEENPMVSSAWLCRQLLQYLETNLDVPIDLLQRLRMERYRIHVKLRLLYIVKSLAREQLHGGFAESYPALPTLQFKACFISFAAQVRGFLGGCRFIIGIDGAHLSGYYKGIMLTEVAIDRNNEIFVLAFGIIDIESIDSWTYFFRNLRCLFAQYGSQKDDWTFISDRMRIRVESALFEVFPRATRRICYQHLYSNCKTAGWSGAAFHKLFWIAANAYNEYVFGKAMSKIKEFDATTYDYLKNVEEQWSVHMFDWTVCCDHNTTNFVESFNAITKANRDMPVFTLLEAVRNWCLKRMSSRFDKAVGMEPNELTEHAKGVLATRTDESRFYLVTATGGGEFEVRDGHVKFPVTLGNMTCGCGKWQGSGIPCKHGLRVIYNQRLDPRYFVSPFYKGATYKLTYGNHIHPMADPTHWSSLDVPEIAPPQGKRKARRPPKQRRRATHEAKKERGT
ncbi:uncharacterized protein LOC130821753 [Amaranthus tricolor]|uniref:uncharacterized protein LOC130821753 n=1 Tax=Amaranthus tricolor TaxID=29722 RepID=UPI00258C182E|nr:uncharacterized protein LOC130821753 [Amaranthus tricolor]